VSEVYKDSCSGPVKGSKLPMPLAVPVPSICLEEGSKRRAIRGYEQSESYTSYFNCIGQEHWGHGCIAVLHAGVVTCCTPYQEMPPRAYIKRKSSSGIWGDPES
jgi:hypothetical protein